jgi:hypothetical protein
MKWFHSEFGFWAGIALVVLAVFAGIGGGVALDTWHEVQTCRDEALPPDGKCPRPGQRLARIGDREVCACGGRP